MNIYMTLSQIIDLTVEDIEAMDSDALAVFAIEVQQLYDSFEGERIYLTILIDIIDFVAARDCLQWYPQLTYKMYQSHRDEIIECLERGREIARAYC
ncbi:hypothetical protein [Shewanella sp. 125m-1]